MNLAAGNCATVMIGINPVTNPNTVADAPSDFAYSTIGPPRTIWNDNALNTENAYAFAIPDGIPAALRPGSMTAPSLKPAPMAGPSLARPQP